MYYVFVIVVISLHLADSVAQLLKALTKAIAGHEAELPRSNGESPLDVASILQLVNELVENLTRLRRLHTNKGRD